PPRPPGALLLAGREACGREDPLRRRVRGGLAAAPRPLGHRRGEACPGNPRHVRRRPAPEREAPTHPQRASALHLRPRGPGRRPLRQRERLVRRPSVERVQRAGCGFIHCFRWLSDSGLATFPVRPSDAASTYSRSVLAAAATLRERRRRFKTPPRLIRAK